LKGCPKSLAMHTRRPKSLNSQELDVLQSALREFAGLELPVLRCTEADGPNEMGLVQWGIPPTLAALGEVRVIEIEDSTKVNHIKFRRPRVSGAEADVVLETPQGLCFCRLYLESTRGWQVAKG